MRVPWVERGPSVPCIAWVACPAWYASPAGARPLGGARPLLGRVPGAASVVSSHMSAWGPLRIAAEPGSGPFGRIRGRRRSRPCPDEHGQGPRQPRLDAVAGRRPPRTSLTAPTRTSDQKRRDRTRPASGSLRTGRPRTGCLASGCPRTDSLRTGCPAVGSPTTGSLLSGSLTMAHITTGFPSTGSHGPPGAEAGPGQRLTG